MVDTQPSLMGIGTVVEITSDETVMGLKHLNACLAAGWRLIATFPVGVAEEGQYLRYSVGWPRDLGDAVHPQVKTPAEELAESRLRARTRYASTSFMAIAAGCPGFGLASSWSTTNVV